MKRKLWIRIGPGVLAPYLVPVKEYLFSFEIRPLK